MRPPGAWLAARLTTAFALLALQASPLAAQWDGFRLFFENDSVVLPRALRTDRNYTTGMRLELRQDPRHQWSLAADVVRICPKLLCPAKLGRGRVDAVSSLVVGQSTFTPEAISVFTPNPDDRPFAGHLYFGAQATVSKEFRRRAGAYRLTATPQTTLEADVGVLGPLSLAGVFQAGMHTAAMHDVPKGWPHQIATEPTVQLTYRVRSAFRGSRGMLGLELTPEASLAAGTVRSFGGFGGSARFGLNLTGLPTSPIGTYLRAPGAVAARPTWEIAAVFAADWKRMWYNAMLDGPALGGGPSVAGREPWVRDVRLGLELRADPLAFSYWRVSRSRETLPQPSLLDFDTHVIESFALEYRPGSRHPVGRAVARALGWTKLELGFGLGNGGDGSAARAGRAVRWALGGGTDSWGIALEQSASAHEAEAPDETGAHTDELFRSFGLSGWAAPRMTGLGRPVLRAGVGVASHRFDTLRDDEPAGQRRRSALRPLLGVGYEVMMPYSNQVMFGVDATWSPIPLLAGSRGRMVLVVLGLKWRPVLP